MDLGFISLHPEHTNDEEFDVLTLVPGEPVATVSSSQPLQPHQNSEERVDELVTKTRQPFYPQCKRILSRPPFLAEKEEKKQRKEDKDVNEKKEVGVKKIKEVPLEELMAIADVPDTFRGEDTKVVSRYTPHHVSSSAPSRDDEVVKRLQHKLTQSENERENLQREIKHDPIGYIATLQTKLAAIPRASPRKTTSTQTINDHGVKCPTCSTYTDPETLLQSFGSDFSYDKDKGIFVQLSSGFVYNPYTQLYKCTDNGIWYYWDSAHNVYHYHSKDHSVSEKLAASHEEDDEEEGEVKDETSLESAAKEAVQESGLKFISSMNMFFNKHTGLYYCQSSGLYYDTKMSVFYKMVDGRYVYHSAAKSEDSATAYAKSSIRAVVRESSCHKVKQGMLFMFTCMGGTIGREGKLTAVFPEMLVSKRHATITYCSGKYFINDEGTMNGTYLNGTRLSIQKHVSERFELSHLDEVKIGSTILQLHIHLNNATCKWCEPGLNNEVDTPSSAGNSSNRKSTSAATISTAATIYRQAAYAADNKKRKA